jgi:hypothetical protein
MAYRTAGELSFSSRSERRPRQKTKVNSKIRFAQVTEFVACMHNFMNMHNYFVQARELSPHL